MTSPGANPPDILNEIRTLTAIVLEARGYRLIDATIRSTGNHFLRKMWQGRYSRSRPMAGWRHLCEVARIGPTLAAALHETQQQYQDLPSQQVSHN